MPCAHCSPARSTRSRGRARPRSAAGGSSSRWWRRRRVDHDQRSPGQRRQRGQGQRRQRGQGQRRQRGQGQRRNVDRNARAVISAERSANARQSSCAQELSGRTCALGSRRARRCPPRVVDRGGGDCTHGRRHLPRSQKWPGGRSSTVPRHPERGVGAKPPGQRLGNSRRNDRVSA